MNLVNFISQQYPITLRTEVQCLGLLLYTFEVPVSTLSQETNDLN